MSSAAELHRVLGGHRSGSGFLLRCPVINHGRGRGDVNPSLSVEDGDGRLLLNCFGGCSHDDVRAALRALGLEKHSGGHRPARTASPLLPPDPAARDLWRSAIPVEGTLAERYLTHHRQITGPFPPSLRFTPALRYPRSGLRMPAMLTGVQGPDRSLIAVQATFLRHSDGAKAPVSEPRWTFGRLGSGAARFAAAGTVLGLAEGTEDALSVIELTGCPCWASLGAGRMATVEIPDSVVELHTFVDADVAGSAAADAVVEHHTSLGRSVVVHVPPAGRKDWNEVLQQHTQQGQAA